MQIDPKHWPNLSRLLDEALEMPAEARERWLESLPPGDSDYKEELRTLLRHGPVTETGDFLGILPSLKDAVDTVCPCRSGAGARCDHHSQQPGGDLRLHGKSPGRPAAV